MEAAPMAGTSASPPTTHSVGIAKGGARLPSTSSRWGRTGRLRTARRMARKVAWRMLSRSISGDGRGTDAEAAAAKEFARHGFALLGADPLAVAHTLDGAAQDHRGGHDGSRQRPTTDLVDAGDQLAPRVAVVRVGDRRTGKQHEAMTPRRLGRKRDPSRP